MYGHAWSCKKVWLNPCIIGSPGTGSALHTHLYITIHGSHLSIITINAIHMHAHAGDTLFALGCGRLFEGDAKTMWSSLSKLIPLPDQTRVYCAHEVRRGYPLISLLNNKRAFKGDQGGRCVPSMR